MSYQDQLIAHLSAYKRSHLGDLPAGAYRHRGQDLSYDHVLPDRGDHRNLLDQSRGLIASFLSASPQIKLHKYFHHLNSSQAFALNLFVPYFEGGPAASRALLGALGQQAELVRWEPEAIPDPAEGSNLDAVWETSDGVTTFCEVKLSERDFGKARHDERHLAKLKEIYLPRLAPHLSRDLQTPAGFFGSYQILRNVWHMVGAPGGRLVFLIPRANAPLWPMVDKVRSGLRSEIASLVRCVAIEDVLDALARDMNCPGALREYSDRLREKYVPRKR